MKYVIENECSVPGAVLYQAIDGEACEAVSPAHCDRLADRVADRILDTYALIDPNARTGIEVTINTRGVSVSGEVAVANLDPDKVNAVAADTVREFAAEAGYPELPITAMIRPQAIELTHASGVGAGDQSLCVGFATAETPELLAVPQVVARGFVTALWRASATSPCLGQDGKVIVCRRSGACEAMLRWQTDGSISAGDTIRLLAQPFSFRRLWVNHAVPFARGSLAVDTGVVGRKLACDFYGTRIPIGGGAISGKDASKVDRFGNYAARWAACELVRRFGGEAQVVLVYTLGHPVPLVASFRLLTTDRLVNGSLEPALFEKNHLIHRFGLDRPEKGFFESIALSGHFGCYHRWD